MEEMGAARILKASDVMRRSSVSNQWGDIEK
jgi:hypothetical protein